MDIQMKGIHKSFGTNKVLKGVNLHLRAAEVHALIGENGAGKSTLMNILTGLFPQDEGEILVDGQVKRYSSPAEAEADGIYFIHQEMITWPDMTVLDNLFMNKEIVGLFGYVKTNEMKKIAEDVFQRLGVKINTDEPMRNLSIGQQQIVEIAKSIMGDSKVIIMDEPTAALTDTETRKLFGIIRELTAQGVSMVYISHRMEEIFEISDRLTVMRDGVSVVSNVTENITEQEVVKNMVGRDIGDYYPDIETEKGRVVFEVENISDGKNFKNVSFQVREGEILGISGLMGAGRTEIMRALFGLSPITEGRMTFKDKAYAPKSPHEAIEQGVGFLTENRKEEGLITQFSIRDNMSLPVIDDFTKAGLVNDESEKSFVDLLIKRLRIKATDNEQITKDLSGGNQQKVVLAKWIGAGSQLLILDEPTRGVDVGAKREIYNLMKELAEHGVAIIMVSSDLPEVIGISDRVLVLHEGQFNGELSGESVTEEKIMTLATGGTL